MTNVSFFIYLFASCIGVAIAVLLLLAFRIRQERAPWKSLLMLFVAVTFMLCLMYFGERFYTDNFTTRGGWSIAERCLDLLLGSGQVIIWCHYLRQKADIPERWVGRVSDAALIAIFLAQTFIYIFLLDTHYYIASEMARPFAVGIYILFMALGMAVLGGHAILLRNRIEDKPTRRYLCGISLLLLADILWESFYCIMLFEGNPILDQGLYRSFDLVSLLFLFIMLLTGLYIYRCEIDRVVPMSPEEAVAAAQQEKEERALTAMKECGLSERETEVAMLLWQGGSYEQIADQLFISRHTVKRHAHNIYQKLDVANRSEMVDLLKG